MKIGHFIKVAILCLLMAAVIGAGAKDSSKHDSAYALINRILELTNNERQRYGLKPLALQPRLIESAKWKAQDMAKRNYFEHEDRPGHDYINRARENGYSDWRYLGENIAAGQRTPEEVVEEWMASPGHRENILRPEFREIGIAFATETHSEYQRYWVQEFGTS
jgi:uncharacterized protein YkwD